MQKLWLLKIDWDEQIPVYVETEWINIREQFATSCSMKIPRWIGLNNEAKHISLQGFCDASEKAIASVVFLRIQNSADQVSCKLIAAKTKVAPLSTISIPRLELNAAVLLALLMNKVKDALKIPKIQQQAWTDSEIVRYWLASHPSRWKTYVAGRVSEIQRSLPSELWRHIGSAQNPADCASRGITRRELENFSLWWHGPTFLLKNEENWPKKIINKPISSKYLEEKSQMMINVIQIASSNPIIEHFSAYEKLLRFSVRCFQWRFSKKEIKKPISVDDITQAEIRLVRVVQSDMFKAEIINLRKGWPVSNKSLIHNLDPYLDKEGVLRVGGRIHRATMTENERHPIILLPKHHFTVLIIRNAHDQTLHGGLALTTHKLRQV